MTWAKEWIFRGKTLHESDVGFNVLKVLLGLRMVLSSDSPVNTRRNSTTSLNRSAVSVRSGYILAQGKSPDESWVGRFTTDYLLCGCLCGSNERKGTALTEDEEEFLGTLRGYMTRPFDSSNPDHISLFKSIWRNAFPEAEMPMDVDARWTRLGFQSSNPRTDVRTGVHSIESLEYISRHCTTDFRRMVAEAGNRDTEYPFAASCVNIAFSLLIFFKLNNTIAVNPVGSPSGSRKAIKQFVRLSLINRNFFDEIFCALVKRVHREWMRQAPGTFDIHYFSVALSVGMTAVAELFNKKRLRDVSDLNQLLVV